MNRIENTLIAARHDLFMAGHGLMPERLEHYRQRVEDLELERDLQFQAYCQSFDTLKKLTAPPPQEPSCLVAMGADEYYDTRGNLREQRHVPYHH